MKTFKYRHPDLQILITGTINGDKDNFNITKISLPQKASKLEKYFLKLVQIYSYDVFMNNLQQEVVSSKEYKAEVNKLKLKIEPHYVV